MVSVRDAIEQILGAVTELGAERIGLLEAVGRVTAEEVRSLRDVPGYPNSAMDGYAVRHVDVRQAPVRLRVVGTSAAGDDSIPTVGPGDAAKIMTGAAIPAGADTVVRVEDTRLDGEAVIIQSGQAKASNIRLPGEDLRAGQLVLTRGRLLSPAAIGLAASVGRTLLLVHRRPRVAILSTGNELVEADQPVETGRVVNSNAYTLAAAVTEAGGVPIALPIARDTPGEIREAFQEASRADAILSTGGVSVGEFDFVKAAMDEVGVQRLFSGVAQKPGKPLTFGMLGTRPYFGLPGNPVSSLVCFYLYARPALRRMMGLRAAHLPTVMATLGHDAKKVTGLTEFIRCRLEPTSDGMVATSTGSQSSAVLSSMAQGQGLIIGAPDKGELRAGSTVRVILLDPEVAEEKPPF
jgi:molybdopterin molybdotransferase